ncbi:amidohydrolase family protein [Anoxynatronum buryatiense]|uniref:5-methylthioadenosine/S-adenosylhomocysteine deaminase n=1 Tax=Anoxynatronum buryatiense TaxID=489973 RepID=A0AA45WY49_9CLOT|nr:amidohydrolase [Anoxynatronum buryatiense]SMP61940.1 5-methylthioadenosine/S-adenosylhomocysteine deaminase [Anoxynatronum buryatiense]
MIDRLIVHATLLTMTDEKGGLLPDGAVAIEGNRILAVGTTQELMERYSARVVHDVAGKAVMPGLVDAHIHTSMALYRGVAQDTHHWLQKGVGPYFSEINEAEAVAGSMLNIVEGLKAGTTTFSDFDNPMPLIAENYRTTGARGRLTATVNQLPPGLHRLKVNEMYPLDESTGRQKLEETLQMLEEWHGKADGRITVMLGPQGPDMVTESLLLEIKSLARTYKTRIHMHVAQGDREINQMERRYGQRTIPWLDSIGYLDEQLVAVHLTEATDEEAALMAKKGAAMIHCPGSIGIIDGMVPPVMAFLEAGGIAGLGSDNAPGNNCNNMFNEMKAAAVFNKIKAKDPTVMPAEKVLRMATIEGARAIGLADEIGSLEPGKKADLIVINTREPGLAPVITAPVSNLVPNLVYAARGHEVEMVIIDGQLVMENRQLLTVDESQVVARAQHLAEQLAARVANRSSN